MGILTSKLLQPHLLDKNNKMIAILLIVDWGVLHRAQCKAGPVAVFPHLQRVPFLVNRVISFSYFDT